MTEPAVVATPPSSAAPAAPQPSPAAPVATPAAIPASTVTPTTSTPPATPAAPVPATPPVSARPSDFPEAYWDGEKNVPHFQKLNEVLTSFAASESRRLSTPAPEAYKTELPKEFVVPQGIEYKFNDADPALADFRKFANETGMSQEQFSKSLGFYAAAQVADQQLISTAKAAEVSKLGANGPARVTQVETFLDGKGYADLKPMLVTAKIVETFEKLMRDVSSQGVAPFGQQHREPGNAGGKVSQETYDKMSPAQRLDYARSFDQSQFQKSA